MVLQKRLDYGFNGYQVPYTPRATRSARRRVPFKKRTDDKNQMCAIDLLATVAGNLLLEKGSPPNSSNASTDNNQGLVVKDSEMKDLPDENKLAKVEMLDQGSCDRGFIVSELVSQVHDQKFSLKESPKSQDDARFGFASVITTSDCSEGFGDQKREIGKTKSEMGNVGSKLEVGQDYGNCKLEIETKKFIKDESDKTGGSMPFGNRADGCGSDEPMVWDGKPPSLVSSDSSAKALCADHGPHSSSPATRDYVNVVSRDDDENSSGCTHPSTAKKFLRSAPRIGDRRIRKILASKYWKVPSKTKDVTLSNNDGDLKAVYRNRNNYYRSIRSERNYPIKKRRLFSSLVNYDEGISSRKNSCFSPERGVDGDGSDFCRKIHGASGAQSSVPATHTSSFQSRDSHVKLRIKSFRVPELFIELPETATVGSLKRRVMEAVNAILGGGLRVGVLLQGKKIRDDNKTLLQTGISRENELDALGFSLEPNTSQNPAPLRADSPRMLPCNDPQPITRYPPSPAVVHQGACDAATELHLGNIGNSIESDHDSAPSLTDMSLDKSTNDSKALVAVPAVSVGALAMVPVHRKSKRSEIVQRRIRRPFSVAEVEALVQAVEKLGTGRWRDVKLRAFDNAKHRTYVDLKDKWKTLVHTARISPQQRRGEPVPQELLDRVLTAHAYWSQQQAKQQLKQQQQQPQQLQQTCMADKTSSFNVPSSGVYAHSTSNHAISIWRD